MHLLIQNGWTALMMASMEEHMECVQVLLDKGADVNMQDKVSGVIIHCAHAMQHVPGVMNEDVQRTLLCAYMYI